MDKNFIAKLETENYLIGSFDVYLEMSKKLIQSNANITLEEAEVIIKSMPTTYRAAIMNKENEYIGYIGLYNVDAQNNVGSIRFEVNNSLSDNDQIEIVEKFKTYLFESLNITEIEKSIFKSNSKFEIKKQNITPKTNVIIPTKMLLPGVSPETLEKFAQDYSVPKLQMPFTIQSSDRVIGLIGLSNLIWSNKRANLNLLLDKQLGSDIIAELSGYIVDDYLNFVHNSNVHNVTLSINGSNKDMIDIINNTNMNYYGSIPYGTQNGFNLESNLMFQHIPNMTKEEKLILPKNQFIPISELDTEKKNLDEYIELQNGFTLVAPNTLEKKYIDSNKVLEDHIKEMQNRDGFAIPLGEDKYILQKGNGNYGISKAIMNYSYIILDENHNYSGYMNILRNNAGGKNAEVEIGIAPKMQHKGLGTIAINRFYEELFSIGYASVTSVVFEFNKPSLKLHERVAEFNGIRLNSYYANGKLWNMNFYSKTNTEIEEKTKKKHI